MSGQRGPILLGTSIFDGASIIDVGDEVTGFPVTNLQDFQPRVKWVSDDPLNSYFIVDLRQTSPRFYTPIYNAVSALFYNARPGAKWRVRTGPTPTGIGHFDSGEKLLWGTGVPGSPGSYRSPLFYQPEGSHTHLLLTDNAYEPDGPSPGEPGNFMTFPGTSGSFVEFGDVIDLSTVGGMSAVVSLRFRNTGGATNQMLLQKGVTTVTPGAFTGYFIGLTSAGAIVAGFGQIGTGVITLSGGSYTDNDWHDVRLLVDGVFGQTSAFLFVDDVQVDTDNNANPLDSSNASPLRLGTTSGGIQVFSGDIERSIITTGTTFEEEEMAALVDEYFQSTQPESVEFPAFVQGAWPASDGSGTTLSDKTTNGRHGTLNGSVGWQSSDSFLSDRYMRVDFLPVFAGIDQDFKLARFVVDIALEPLVIYGSGTPTPVGSPPKLVNTWDCVLSREKVESIVYRLALNRGSSPRVLTSWGNDVFLLDGAKPVVMVNNVLAPDPWTRHQGTVYGYLDPISPIQISAFEEYRTNITVRGM